MKRFSRRRLPMVLLYSAAMVAFAAVAVLRPFRRPAAPNLDPAGVVEYVFDGDTVGLADGRTVRYIGIDCPEMDASSPRLRAVAGEADNCNSALVAGREVRLEFDIETIDKYGRTLAYVWVDDKMVAAELVSQGLARVVTYGRNARYEHMLSRLERQAQMAGKGLWAAPEENQP